MKDLQEKNYKLEFESKSKASENEKRAFKDLAEENKNLEEQLREKIDIIEELEMQRFNLEEKITKE